MLLVGIGASAGGLEAMSALFSQLRPNGRTSYVVAQHMAHNGHSDLVAKLLGQAAAIPVLLAENQTRLQPDRIYLIPAGWDGVVQHETLTLVEPIAGHISTPSVNVLFRSIAASSGPQGVGVILSGTGLDGVSGCREIKAKNGLVVVQTPEETKFDGMPATVLDAGLADQVLPVSLIAQLLSERADSGTGLMQRAPDWQPSALDQQLAERIPDYADPVTIEPGLHELNWLLPRIQQETGIDFTAYKEETLLRRLLKRKESLGIASAEAYRELVRREPGELKILQHQFLVSLSSFFRDRKAFVELERALAVMLAGRPVDQPIRIWVPGCASGEEAYTIAIILSELLGADQRQLIDITATDLNPEALDIARKGVYRQTAFKEMETALRDRYCLPKGQHLIVKPELAARIRFEQRDLTVEAPMDDLDLISCRNLLIYLKSPLQERLVKCFHQSLRAGGLLFIGQSESLAGVGTFLFTPIDHYHRLFRKR